MNAGITAFLLNLLAHTPVVVKDVEDVVAKIEGDHGDTAAAFRDGLVGVSKVLGDAAG